MNIKVAAFTVSEKRGMFPLNEMHGQIQDFWKGGSSYKGVFVVVFFVGGGGGGSLCFADFIKKFLMSHENEIIWSH